MIIVKTEPGSEDSDPGSRWAARGQVTRVAQSRSGWNCSIGRDVEECERIWPWHGSQLLASSIPWGHEGSRSLSRLWQVPGSQCSGEAWRSLKFRGPGLCGPWNLLWSCQVPPRYMCNVACSTCSTHVLSRIVLKLKINYELQIVHYSLHKYFNIFVQHSLSMAETWHLTLGQAWKIAQSTVFSYSS